MPDICIKFEQSHLRRREEEENPRRLAGMQQKLDDMEQENGWH